MGTTETGTVSAASLKVLAEPIGDCRCDGRSLPSGCAGIAVHSVTAGTSEWSVGTPGLPLAPLISLASDRGDALGC